MFAKRNFLIITLLLLSLNLLLANNILWANIKQEAQEEEAEEAQRHSVPSTINQNLTYHYITEKKHITKQEAQEKLSPFWLESEASSPRPIFNLNESQEQAETKSFLETSQEVKQEAYWEKNPLPRKKKSGLFSPQEKAQTAEQALQTANLSTPKTEDIKNITPKGGLFAPTEDKQIKEKTPESEIVQQASTQKDIFKETQAIHYYMYKDEAGVIHMTDIPTDSRYNEVTLNVEVQMTTRLGPKKKLSHEALRPLIIKAANTHNLDPALIAAVIKSESSFDPNAVSWAGAQGLMQLIPSTAALVGCKDPFDPESNIMGGSRYLKMMLDRFQGNVTLAVAAYNCGPSRVAKQWKVPNIKETQNYVKIVAANYEKFKEYF